MQSLPCLGIGMGRSALEWVLEWMLLLLPLPLLLQQPRRTFRRWRQHAATCCRWVPCRFGWGGRGEGGHTYNSSTHAGAAL